MSCPDLEPISRQLWDQQLANNGWKHTRHIRLKQKNSECACMHCNDLVIIKTCAWMQPVRNILSWIFKVYILVISDTEALRPFYYFWFFGLMVQWEKQTVVGEHTFFPTCVFFFKCGNVFQCGLFQFPFCLDILVPRRSTRPVTAWTVVLFSQDELCWDELINSTEITLVVNWPTQS